MKRTITFFCFFFILGLCNYCIAQKNYSLHLYESNSKRLLYTDVFTDSLQLNIALKKKIESLRFKGYFNLILLKYEWNKKDLNVEVDLGKLFEGISISNGNIEDATIAYQIKKKKVFNLEELQVFYESVIQHYENNGYPFVTIGLDSFVFKNEKIEAKIVVVQNSPVKVDSIIIVGNAKLSPNFLYSYLNIKQQDYYAENKIAKIDKRLQNLGYVDFVKPSEIVFSGEKARVNIFINQKNANQFDGVIGFLPSANSSKVQLTGDFKLKLQNTLKRGEMIDLNYKGLPNQSQQLLTNINFPYLFLSKVGFYVDFQFFKRDSSFLNLNSKIAFTFSLAPEKYLSLFIENYRSSLINQKASNKINGVQSVFYGAGADIDKTDNFLSPRKGYQLKLSLGVGQRDIQNLENSTQPIKNVQYKSSVDFNYYLKLSNHFNIFLHQQSAFLSGRQLYENEVFRIGGFKTLRGFLEQSLLVNSYAVQTSELRYYIEKKSFLFTFYDQAWTQSALGSGIKNNYPFGLGAGINFETKLGMVSFSYALGKQQNNPINLQKGNIHFGIVSNF